ncbi:hypothetical protein SAMN05444387_3653 [Flavobacterium pectinovorum]|uniref:Uncharacterized protein n=1 Tax=Flavobacterium pectinovorum TaxID=29533 RepID=A0AB36P310_9FLAO|nr:hypothetical protein B0A72_09385 [Flavobacterium pectinovorum]SHM97710.1 hypothetical protein SAMN05444387_3653 [Flavobacterium pectinovorum]
MSGVFFATDCTIKKIFFRHKLHEFSRINFLIIPHKNLAEIPVIRGKLSLSLTFSFSFKNRLSVSLQSIKIAK